MRSLTRTNANVYNKAAPASVPSSLRHTRVHLQPADGFAEDIAQRGERGAGWSQGQMVQVGMHRLRTEAQSMRTSLPARYRQSHNSTRSYHVQGALARPRVDARRACLVVGALRSPCFVESRRIRPAIDHAKVRSGDRRRCGGCAVLRDNFETFAEASATIPVRGI